MISVNEHLGVQDLQRQAKLLLHSSQPGGDEPIRLRVTSDSMSPMLEPGDFVVVARADISGLRRGDLVVFRRMDDFITHRLLKFDAAGIQTKGDQRILVDPLAPLEALLGKVVAVQRQRTVRDFSTRYWRVANRWLGWLGWLEANAFRVVGRWLSLPFRLIFRISAKLAVKQND